MVLQIVNPVAMKIAALCYVMTWIVTDVSEERADFIFYPEAVGNKFLRNVGAHLSNWTSLGRRP